MLFCIYLGVSLIITLLTMMETLWISALFMILELARSGVVKSANIYIDMSQIKK